MKLFITLFLTMFSFNSYSQIQSRENCYNYELVDAFKEKIQTIGIDGSSKLSIYMNNIKTGNINALQNDVKIRLSSKLTIKNSKAESSTQKATKIIRFKAAGSVISLKDKANIVEPGLGTEITYTKERLIAEFEDEIRKFKNEECVNYKKILASSDLELQLEVERVYVKALGASIIYPTVYAQRAEVTKIEPMRIDQDEKTALEDYLFLNTEANPVKRFSITTFNIIDLFKKLKFEKTDESKSINLSAESLGTFAFDKDNAQDINDNILPISFDITIQIAE